MSMLILRVAVCPGWTVSGTTLAWRLVTISSKPRLSWDWAVTGNPKIKKEASKAPFIARDFCPCLIEVTSFEFDRRFAACPGLLVIAPFQGEESVAGFVASTPLK